MTLDTTSTVRWHTPPVVPGLLDLAPIPSAVVDADGHVLWSNAAATSLLRELAQRVRTELDPLTIHALLPGAPLAPLMAGIHAVLEPGPPESDRLEIELNGSDHRAASADLHLGRIDDHTVMVQIILAASDRGTGAAPTRAERLRTLVDSLVSLNDVARHDDDHDEFHRALLCRAIEIVPGAQGGTVLVRRPGTDVFDHAAAHGFDLTALRETVISADGLIEYLADAAPRHRTERIDDAAADITVPVVADGQVVAVLRVVNFTNASAFDEQSVETVTVLSRLIADVLTRRRVERDLRREGESFRHLAHHDPLTGLPNRRRIEQAMMDVAGASFNAGEAMAVLFADLDGFKRINDTHGHDAGDVVLQITARRLGRAIRQRDVVGRWGGDEFVILAPNVDTAATARHLAERILERCPPEITLPDGHVVTCAMSIGVDWSNNEYDELWAMLRRADDALYRAKAAGGGRVRVFGRT